MKTQQTSWLVQGILPVSPVTKHQPVVMCVCVWESIRRLCHLPSVSSLWAVTWYQKLWAIYSWYTPAEFFFQSNWLTVDQQIHIILRFWCLSPFSRMLQRLSGPAVHCFHRVFSCLFQLLAKKVKMTLPGPDATSSSTFSFPSWSKSQRF